MRCSHCSRCGQDGSWFLLALLSGEYHLSSLKRRCDPHTPDPRLQLPALLKSPPNILSFRGSPLAGSTARGTQQRAQRARKNLHPTINPTAMAEDDPMLGYVL
ncbi:hypothetical protein NDU88_009931 [Pleurodeles waltl]|uniref:Uncharacterized protein n=1 Tax=Pleurodeles waltl TaxID=8319 RepID=A0AAV7RXI9_PLEWA|nr:hypothetical protein NDU88_009931 [Pleurodeles waltl]